MAISVKDLNIGYAYNVTIKAGLESYFANRYNNIVVIGLIDYQEACKVTDVATLMANVNTAQSELLDAKLVTYIKFKSETNNEFIIPINVIESASVVSLYALSVTITNVTSDDATIILNQIKKLGYTDAKVTRTEMVKAKP